MDKYLKPTPAIDCDSESIQEKAHSLTEKCEGTAEEARTLFYFVRDEIEYNAYVPSFRFEDHKASRTLKKKEGYCVQKAVLLAALARARNIPTRLSFANIRNHLLPEKFMELLKGENLLVYHGYNEFYIEGEWIKATPTFDLEMCRRQNFVPVDFDGENDAVLNKHDQNGRLHIEYVEDIGHFGDLPYEDMIQARIQRYGEDYYKKRKKFRKYHENNSEKSEDDQIC